MLKENHSTPPTEPFLFVNGFNSVSFRPALSKLEPSKHAYLDNRGTTAQKLNKRQQTSASERLEKKQKTKEKLILLLEKIAEKDLAERLRVCSSKWTTITCGSHVISRRPNHRCEFRLCSFCAARRSRKIQTKYLPLLNEFLRTGKRSTPVHLVLTQKHRRGETLNESKKRLMSSFKKLQRREFWQNHFYGGIYAFEATISDGLYHSHLHILAFRRRFFDVSILRREWQKTTGDSHVLRLDRISDIESGLREVVKYISKPLDIEKFSLKHLREMLELKGQRMFGAFGLFAKFCRTFDASDIEKKGDDENYSGYCEGDACPLCQKPLFEMVLPIEILIGFMRKIEAIPRR
jgi:plasmid rolling circle replication initiator protein Rep